MFQVDSSPKFKIWRRAKYFCDFSEENRKFAICQNMRRGENQQYLKISIKENLYQISSQMLDFKIWTKSKSFLSDFKIYQKLLYYSPKSDWRKMWIFCRNSISLQEENVRNHDFILIKFDSFPPKYTLNASWVNSRSSLSSMEVTLRKQQLWKYISH